MAKLNAREQFLLEQREKNRPKFYYATRITVGADNFLYLKSLDKPHIKFQPDERTFGLSVEHLISDLHFAYITWDLVQTINVMRHENSDDVTDYGRYVINDLGVGNRQLPDPSAIDADVMVVEIGGFTTVQAHRNDLSLEADDDREPDEQPIWPDVPLPKDRRLPDFPA